MGDLLLFNAFPPFRNVLPPQGMKLKDKKKNTKEKCKRRHKEARCQWKLKTI